MPWSSGSSPYQKFMDPPLAIDRAGLFTGRPDAFPAAQLTASSTEEFV